MHSKKIDLSRVSYLSEAHLCVKYIENLELFLQSESTRLLDKVLGLSVSFIGKMLKPPESEENVAKTTSDLQQGISKSDNCKNNSNKFSDK